MERCLTTLYGSLIWLVEVINGDSSSNRLLSILKCVSFSKQLPMMTAWFCVTNHQVRILWTALWAHTQQQRGIDSVLKEAAMKTERLTWTTGMRGMLRLQASTYIMKTHENTQRGKGLKRTCSRWDTASVCACVLSLDRQTQLINVQKAVTHDCVECVS